RRRDALLRRHESPRQHPEDRGRRGSGPGGRGLPLGLRLDRVPAEPLRRPGCSRHGDLLLRDAPQEWPARHLLQPAPDRGVRVHALPACWLPPLLVRRAGEGADHLGPEARNRAGWADRRLARAAPTRYVSRSDTAIWLDGNAMGTTTAGDVRRVTDRYRHPWIAEASGSGSRYTSRTRSTRFTIQ